MNTIALKRTVRRIPDVGDWVKLRKPYRPPGSTKRYTKGIVSEILYGGWCPLLVLHFPAYRDKHGRCIDVDYGPSQVIRL